MSKRKSPQKYGIAPLIKRFGINRSLSPWNSRSSSTNINSYHHGAFSSIPDLKYNSAYDFISKAKSNISANSRGNALIFGANPLRNTLKNYDEIRNSITFPGLTFSEYSARPKRRNLPPMPTSHILSESGYSTKDLAIKRRKAIMIAVDAENEKLKLNDEVKAMNKIIKSMNLRRIFFKNNNKKVYDVMSSDIKWLQRKRDSSKKRIQERNQRRSASRKRTESRKRNSPSRKLKPCKKNQYRNPKTNRCKKK